MHEVVLLFFLTSLFSKPVCGAELGLSVSVSTFSSWSGSWLGSRSGSEATRLVCGDGK